MEILGEIGAGSGTPLIRLYRSEAASRHGNFRIHHHAACELGFIERGEGIYRADREYRIGPGDLFWFGSNEAHCITDIEDGMTILNLHISPQYFRMLNAPGTEKSAPGTALFRMRFTGNRLNEVLPQTELDRILKLLREVVSEFSSSEEDHEFLAETWINAILILLARHSLKSDVPRVSQAGAEAVFRSMDHIDAHFADDLSLEMLSREAALEKTYYASLFKRTTGMTPWEYLTLRRVEAAIRLLRDTRMNVLDIALRCGFSNTASFNKNFKKYTGLTPKQVRG